MASPSWAVPSLQATWARYTPSPHWVPLAIAMPAGIVPVVVWCGVVWCGVVWCGVVWCGVVWNGVVWCGVVWCGVVWCGVVWCGVPKALLPKGKRPGCLPTGKGKRAGLCVLCARRA